MVVSTSEMPLYCYVSSQNWILYERGTSISGAKFTINYPVQALRLVGPQSLRLGSSIPAGVLPIWNVAPSQNNYGTQNGHVTVALSSATSWPAGGSNSVLAELTFQVQ